MRLFLSMPRKDSSASRRGKTFAAFFRKGNSHMELFFLCLGYYILADLAINVGYHRCLSHRSLQLRKWLERTFISFGLPAGTPIQWVANHRYHHLYSDQPGDPHSPHQGGFWHAHVGWYLGTENLWICLPYCYAGPLRTLFDGWLHP